MTIEEARIRLRTKLEDMLGVEETSILMDRPPGGWGELATNRSLDALEARLDRRFDELERRMNDRFADVDRRFGDVDRRFGDIDRRFSELEANMGLRIDSATDRLRGQLDRRFRAQTWSLVAMMFASMSVLVAAVRL